MHAGAVIRAPMITAACMIAARGRSEGEGRGGGQTWLKVSQRAMSPLV
jgi:hypothetical protein